MTTEDDWLTRRTGVVPTAAPADKLSPKSVLDEATRPTAPEPAAEVAVLDVLPPNPSRRWPPESVTRTR